MNSESYFLYSPALSVFAKKFAAGWRNKFALLCVFASIVFFIPALAASLWMAALYFESINPHHYGYAPTFSIFEGIFLLVGSAAAIVVLVPAGVLMITAPKMLAPVAAGIIDRLDLLFLLYIPLTDEDYARNRFMEYFAGAPVADSRINLSFTSRIWWLSGQMKPELLLGGIPRYMAGLHGDLPYSLADGSMPVGRLGPIVIRQWYFYVSQTLAWGSCCCSSGCFFVFAPYFVYRVVANVHALAYAAAYYRILTGHWPWEERLM